MNQKLLKALRYYCQVKKLPYRRAKVVYGEMLTSKEQNQAKIEIMGVYMNRSVKT